MTETILATCSRSFKDWSGARAILTRVYDNSPDAVLMHGDAEQGDRQTAGIWRSLGGVDDPRPAKWEACGWDCPPRKHRKIRQSTGEEYCPGAGLRRNTEMVESAPVQVLAFLDWKSKTGGAFHCAGLAEDAGIPTIRFPAGGAK